MSARPGHLRAHPEHLPGLTATAFSLLGLRQLYFLIDGLLDRLIGVLVVTIAASLLSPTGKAQTAIANARRHATSYLDAEYTADSAERERIFRALLDERDQIVALGPKYRQMARDEAELVDLLERALASHDEAVARGEAAPIGEPKIVRRR